MSTDETLGAAVWRALEEHYDACDCPEDDSEGNHRCFCCELTWHEGAIAAIVNRVAREREQAAKEAAP